MESKGSFRCSVSKTLLDSSIKRENTSSRITLDSLRDKTHTRGSLYKKRKWYLSERKKNAGGLRRRITGNLDPPSLVRPFKIGIRSKKGRRVPTKKSKSETFYTGYLRRYCQGSLWLYTLYTGLETVSVLRLKFKRMTVDDTQSGPYN